MCSGDTERRGPLLSDSDMDSDIGDTERPRAGLEEPDIVVVSSSYCFDLGALAETTE